MNSFSASKALVLAAGLSAFGGAVLTVMQIDDVWIAAVADGLSVLAAGGAFLAMLRTHRTLRDITGICARAANGDLEARILEAPVPGLIGDTQCAVNRLIDIADAFVREAAGSMTAVSRGHYYRKVLVRGLPGGFGAAASMVNQAILAAEAKVRDFQQFAQDNVAEVVAGVASASTQLHASAGAMASTATDLAQQASFANRETDGNIHEVASVAAATEQLSASISEILRQVSQSSGVAHRAVEETRRTSGTIASLIEAAANVGTIVHVVQEIAGQTNLLALNATIEAARAGDAGKGFAVVAGEVKSLAAKTDAAIGEITAQVKAIQDIAHSASRAIADIGERIREMDEATASVAAAVEQQGAATREIAASIQAAASGTQRIAHSIETVAGASVTIGANAEQVLMTSSELSRNSETLNSGVKSFMQRARRL
jgi:methyl-accepting chemotaxis protein